MFKNYISQESRQCRSKDVQFLHSSVCSVSDLGDIGHTSLLTMVPLRATRGTIGCFQRWVPRAASALPPWPRAARWNSTDGDDEADDTRIGFSVGFRMVSCLMHFMEKATLR
jgi:hypothetical protein